MYQDEIKAIKWGIGIGLVTALVIGMNWSAIIDSIMIYLLTN